MKKVKILGKQLPVMLVTLIVIAGLGGATLVSYLSSTHTTTATVDSPIQFKLYGSDLAELSTTQTMEAGETLEFFKIAKNKADVGTKFAIALVVQGTKDGIIVDSAGPKVSPEDTVDTNGVPLAWDDTNKWWQNYGEDWYLHGAHEKYTDYKWWDGSQWVSGSNPQNNEYNDAEGITIGEEDYYIVIFGGTIGDNSVSVHTPIVESDEITNWGWGTPSGYTRRGADEALVMPPDDAYDVGKVRVYFASDLTPGDYIVKVAVITPHYTVGEIIAKMFA